MTTDIILRSWSLCETVPPKSGLEKVSLGTMNQLLGPNKQQALEVCSLAGLWPGNRSEGQVVFSISVLTRLASLADVSVQGRAGLCREQGWVLLGML